MQPRFNVLAACILAWGPIVGAASCTRLDILNGRLEAVPSSTARQVLRDSLWKHGSHYRWADRTTIRCEVTRTEHRPRGDISSDEIWLLDTAGDRVRIEKPDRSQVALVDGATWRVFVDGKQTKDPRVRAEVAADVRMVRELLPMPFSLLRPGLDIAYLGTRVGPGETRSWHQLLVMYRPESGSAPTDRTLVEIRRDTLRPDAAVIRWSEVPLLGRRFRVELDDWRRHEGFLLSRRWRFFPLERTGTRTGPLRYTVRIKKLEMDAAVTAGTFTRP